MKTALFIDGANIHWAGKNAGIEIDYSRVLTAFPDVFRATYYTALLPERDGVLTLRPLIDWLEYNGYAVVSKQSKSFSNVDTGVTKVKGNMDVEMVVDIMNASLHCDHIIIFSGDGDFTYAIKDVQRRGVIVTVVSTMNTVADELRRVADLFLDMTDPRVRSKIEKRRG